jgi:penicillin-binding protein 2
MAIGLAALKYRVINPNTTFYCDRFIEVGGHKFYCHSKDGHGSVNLESAIACSCDVFFYQVGRIVGVKRMSEMFRILGLNENLAMIPDIKNGVLPDEFPVRYAADTILASIGHGNFSTTAMHLCVMMCRLITNKKIIPYIEKNDQKSVIDDLNINENDLSVIFSGMNKAFNSEIGTGRNYVQHLTDLKMFGKTTTTQVVRVQRDADGKALRNQYRKWEERDHSMCCSAVDINGDYYVLSVLIEHGGWGRLSADLCAKIFQEMKNQGIMHVFLCVFLCV